MGELLDGLARIGDAVSLRTLDCCAAQAPSAELKERAMAARAFPANQLEAACEALLRPARAGEHEYLQSGRQGGSATDETHAPGDLIRP